jgi:hypothetical protein
VRRDVSRWRLKVRGKLFEIVALEITRDEDGVFESARAEVTISKIGDLLEAFPSDPSLSTSSSDETIAMLYNYDRNIEALSTRVRGINQLGADSMELVLGMTRSQIIAAWARKSEGKRVEPKPS